MYIWTFCSSDNDFHVLTHKHPETHECILNTVATDALVLKHQVISTHSAEQICIALDQYQIKLFHL